MKLLKPPCNDLPINIPSIFLAGSIEMGKAEMWQDHFANAMSDLDIVIYNPRRDDWDSSWVQDISNPCFRDQVEWELIRLESSNVIAMYFDPSTKSPISLLELGLHARTNKLLVCCPSGFWRKGNVDIVCNRYGIPNYESVGELACACKFEMERLCKKTT